MEAVGGLMQTKDGLDIHATPDGRGGWIGYRWRF